MQTEFSPSKNASGRAESPVLFILMGASNLARGYTALVNCLARCLHPRPIEVLHAMGPGRGYCREGGVFHIVYPPIGISGLLSAAGERATNASRVIALITDIGNDIMYNVPASEIIFCLDGMLNDLNRMGAKIFVNPIPLVIEEDVSELQFRILRRVFFPQSPVDYSGAADAVREINQFLQESAGERIHLLPSAKDFCGADKIHYSMLRSHKAWSNVAEALLRELSLEKAGEVSPFSAWCALFANMGRVFFCDMIPVRKKNPGTF